MEKVNNEDSIIPWLSKSCSVIIITWAASFLFILFLARLDFGSFPVYGIHPDPNSSDSLIFNAVHILHIISFILGFMALPGWLIIQVYFLLNKFAFIKRNLLFNLPTLLAVSVFLIFKFLLKNQFLWVFD